MTWSWNIRTRITTDMKAMRTQQITTRARISWASWAISLMVRIGLTKSATRCRARGDGFVDRCRAFALSPSWPRSRDQAT